MDLDREVRRQINENPRLISDNSKQPLLSAASAKDLRNLCSHEGSDRSLIPNRVGTH